MKSDYSFDELRHMYSGYFSLGNLNKDISSKFFLISAICNLTKLAKAKCPDITHWQVIYKLADGMQLPEEFLKGLAIVCEDFSYGCTEFPTFGISQKELIPKAKEILNTYMPF